MERVFIVFLPGLNYFGLFFWMFEIVLDSFGLCESSCCFLLLMLFSFVSGCFVDCFGRYKWFEVVSG